MSLQAIGIDVGGTYTKLTIISEDGEIPILGRRCVDGMYLPDDVLKKIYRANAMKVFQIEQNS